MKKISKEELLLLFEIDLEYQSHHTIYQLLLPHLHFPPYFEILYDPILLSLTRQHNIPFKLTYHLYPKRKESLFQTKS